MGNSVKGWYGRIVAWLSKHHVALVVLLSLLHIGLSCLHARDSGGADPSLCRAIGLRCDQEKAMETGTLLWEAIGDARMAVHHCQQEVILNVGVTHVRVWRQDPGIEGIKVDFLFDL
jgi:hypothetical protein